MLKVLKFGGSSLADARQFAKVKSIVEADPARRVVIVSAPGKRFSGDHKITDLLYLCAAHIKYGVSCEDIFAMIRDRYNEIIAECGLHISLDKEFDALWDKMKNGISQDELASRGEYFSARLMAEYLGYEFVDAARWIKFKFDGTVDQDASYAALRSLAEDRKVVIPGFYGVMPDGHIRTFSRGGSDITGALAAAALGADVYENWTDVSGILMADPRIVDDPEPIRRVTYSELRELSYIGAQVLHEGTIFPVREKNIPLNIRNTNAPDHPGTMILESIGDEMEEGGFITGIAGKKGFSIITIAKTGMSSEPGSLLKILNVLAKHEVNVEYLPSGIDNVSLVVSSDKVSRSLYEMLGELQKEVQPNKITVTEHIAIVAAVGRKMAYRPGVSGKIFAKLGENGVNIRMITQGPEELNIIVGVEEKDFEQAIRVLYNSFCEGECSVMKQVNVGILGATGAVGQEMIKILEERNFPVASLRPIASARSAGSKIMFRGQECSIVEASDDAFEGLDIVLGAAENDIAERFAPSIVKAGAVFVDNSSAFRLDPNVPLVIPEINPEDVKWHKGIISNPNCTTIVTLVAINALAKESPIETIIASSYQAVSGAGKGGIDELNNEVKALSEGKHLEPKVFQYQIAYNIIPQIGGEAFEGYTSEEMKMQNEGRKILHLPELKVSCTCARVPVIRSHSVSVVLRTKEKISVERAKELIANAPGCKLVDDLKNKVYPMPLDTSDQDIVYVGRIREDLTDERGLNLWCCGDQVRKGAATNTIQIAELLLK